jgi:hypothetical protein
VDSAALTPACMSTALTDMDGVQDDVVERWRGWLPRREKAATEQVNSLGPKARSGSVHEMSLEVLPPGQWCPTAGLQLDHGLLH